MLDNQLKMTTNGLAGGENGLGSGNINPLSQESWKKNLSVIHRRNPSIRSNR